MIIQSLPLKNRTFSHNYHLQSSRDLKVQPQMRKNTTSSFSETRNRANQSAIELIRCKTKESTNNTPK